MVQHRFKIGVLFVRLTPCAAGAGTNEASLQKSLSGRSAAAGQKQRMRGPSPRLRITAQVFGAPLFSFL
ncbi:hypothetical protein MA20_41940 [Bradyrhizobium japonicum]|uniref:Secreted protein n=1 Tax=Bradyrhizobium japonicum TaxID=375 RepID=A0A0A3XHH7_BRAJP|nr:hypothetical protein MA20_41940 [Bradyrhizobium japonicum]